LRRQLALFAAALGLPILVFMAFILGSLSLAERDRIENEAASAARTLANAVDRELLSLTSALQVLAVSPELVVGDLAAFYARAVRLRDELGVNAVLRDLDGQQLLNARVPFGEPLPRTPAPSDPDVIAADRPVVLDLFQGAVSGTPLFAVDTVIRDDRRALYLLSLTVPADRMRQLLAGANLPASWTIAIVDGNDMILARNNRHEDFVGQEATDDLRRNTQGIGGTWDARTIDGQSVFGTYARTAAADWRVVIGVRTAEINAPMWRSLQFFALIGIATLGLSLLLAAVFARRISGSAAELAGQATQLAEGAAVEERPSKIEEFQRISHSIATASATIRAREDALRESEAKFRAIADTMPQMVWSTTPDGLHDYYNARWYEFTGVPVGSTDGEGWNDMFHPDDQKRAMERWQHSLATGEPYQIEYRLRHHSGTYRWTLGRALPIRDEDDRITRWFGTCTDIHESRLAADEREIITQELSHRIKNIFSVLGSIVSLTARSHPQAKEFAAEIRDRILSLGRAHEFVRPRPQDGGARSTLHGLMKALLAPFDDRGERIVLSGDDVEIDDGAATPLALTFHELGTNAAKYGSLSVEGGRLVVTGLRDGSTFRIIWHEIGRTGAEASTGTGFGTKLIELSIKGQMNGEIERHWEEDGLRIEIALPVWALTRSAKRGASTEDQAAAADA
jgi:PAS domain S-box-containing protein